MKLVKFLKKLKNEYVKIETKENKTIEGKINKVDKYSNVTLDNITVRGSNIRYIVMREDIDLESLLVDEKHKKTNRITNNKI